MSLPMKLYGQVLDHPLCCTKAEARRCWTVKDRMLVTVEPEFDVYCKENYQLEDDINKVTDDDNNGYFSEDDLPLDEMNEVADEWFEDHLMDGVTPAKSANHSKKKDKKEPTEKPPPEGLFRWNPPRTKSFLCLCCVRMFIMERCHQSCLRFRTGNLHLRVLLMRLFLLLLRMIMD